MSDNKQNVGEPDRSRVSGSEDYEVRYFAETHGISPERVRHRIAQHGKERDAASAPSPVAPSPALVLEL